MRRLRIRQAVVIALGSAVAVAMLLLGLWQMQVFEDQGNRTAVERAAQPPVPLLDQVLADGTVADVYGKQVTVTGDYLADQQVLVVDAGGVRRVVTALRLPDDRVVAVVRGVSANGALPSPPAGTLTQTGIFLPSEPGADHAVGADELGSVRLPLLAQRWPQGLLPGFITLSPVESSAHGLAPATVELPTGDGSWRNGGYALQWWIFAAFAFWFSLRFAASLGRTGGVATMADQEER